VGVVIRSFLAQQGLRNSTCFPLDLLPDDNRLDGPEGKLDDRPRDIELSRVKTPDGNSHT